MRADLPSNDSPKCQIKLINSFVSKLNEVDEIHKLFSLIEDRIILRNDKLILAKSIHRYLTQSFYSR